MAERALKLKTYMQIAENSPWARMMKPTSGRAAVLLAADERPLYLCHAAIDLPAYLDMVDKLIGLEGVSVAQGKEVIKAATGLDLEADILSVFTGEIGFAVSGDLAQVMDAGDKAPQAINGSATLGVTDVAKAVALLDKVAGLALFEGFVKKLEGNKGWEVPVPEWKSVYVTFVGKQLCISTDPGFAGRVAAGTKGKYLAGLEDGELKELLDTPEPSGLAVLDFGSFSFLFFAVAMKSGDWDMARAEAAGGEQVPYSQEYQDKKKELEEHGKKVRKMRDEIESETNERVGNMLKRVGVTVAVGKNVPGGQVGYGGHFVADESITALIDHLIEDGMALEELDRTKRREVWELEDKKWEMQRQLDEIRAKDVQQHMENKVGAAEEIRSASEVGGPDAP